MKISFVQKVRLATHIERKLSKINFRNSEVEKKVYEDFERQFKREFALNRKKPNLDEKYIYEAHEFIDAYEVPTYLKEIIDNANAQISLGIS